MNKNFLRHLRSLFPSWNFFDDLGNNYELWSRICYSKNHLSPWEKCLIRKHQRTIFNLLLNSHENLRFAYQTVIEHCVQEIQDSPFIKNYDSSVSYNLLLKVAKKYETQKNPHSKNNFQFKITSNGEDILLSHEHAL